MLNLSSVRERKSAIYSRDIETAREVLAQLYVKPTLEIDRQDRPDFNFYCTTWPLQRLGLSYGGYGSAIRTTFPGASEFLQMFAVSGRGEVKCGNAATVLAPGDSTTIPVSIGYTANYNQSYSIIALRINPAMLELKLAMLTGRPINAPLQLNKKQNSPQPAKQALRSYVSFLTKELHMVPPRVTWPIAQCEELLLTLFLYGNQHNYSHLLEQDQPDAAPWQADCIEERIEAGAGDPSWMEDVVRLTGASGMSLSRAFKKRRGCSPRAFAARMRARRKPEPE